MIRKCACSPVGRVIGRQLQADAEAQALWLGRPLDQVVQCGREIRIPVSRDLNEQLRRAHFRRKLTDITALISLSIVSVS